jgi:tryptophan-rich sensory protein
VTWTILVAAFCATVVAACGGILTKIGPWYRGLRKPSWQPPDWLFAPAWTLIFALAATSGVLGWYAAPTTAIRTEILALFAVNGLLNIGWSWLFFTLRRPDWALGEVALLWLSILALIVALWPTSRHAAWALVPYLLWVSFASFLNWTIVRLNRPFDAASPARI